LASRALIRDSGKFVPGYAIAAAFVHIDQTLKSGKDFVDRYCDPEIVTRYPRESKIFNVWRAMTPPPQDVPLAICDQRTLDQRDWVQGSAVEPGMPGFVDNFTSVHNPAQRWHYFADLTPDEMIVFKAWDNGPNALMGCLHGAFQHPNVPKGTVPRVSAEIRFFCFFEN
jgi:hypothetical protein